MRAEIPARREARALSMLQGNPFIESLHHEGDTVVVTVVVYGALCIARVTFMAGTSRQEKSLFDELRGTT